MANLIVPRAPGLGVEIDESVIDTVSLDTRPLVVFPHGFPAETRAVTCDHSVQWERRSAG